MKLRTRSSENTVFASAEPDLSYSTLTQAHIALGRMACGLALASALCPSVTKASERILDLEAGIRFAPKACKNPYQNPDGSVRVLTGEVEVDEHGHAVGTSNENEKSDTNSDCHVHPKWMGAFSYLYAHEFKENDQEDPDFVGPKMEEGHEGHPSHRIRFQILKDFDRGEVGPSIELGLGGLHQLGFGAFEAFHLAKNHELALMQRVRVPLQKGTGVLLSSWELGAFYSFNIFKHLGAGVNLLAEGHRKKVEDALRGTFDVEGEAHWGVGPTLRARLGLCSVSLEAAVGPGERLEEGNSKKRDKAWLHTHAVVTCYIGGAAGHGH